MGKLFIVATPIGNLEDISARALVVLRSVDYVLCEDTRVTKKLLMHFDINRPTFSYHQHSGEVKKLEILRLLGEGKDLALVSDAGTPGISDPGNELVAFLADNQPNVEIVPIPGPSSVTAALSVCGFPVSGFTFIGYFPKKGKSNVLEMLKGSRVPVVFFESPYRIGKTIDTLMTSLGADRMLCICQELTKVHERVLRASLKKIREALTHEQSSLGRVKGEVVVVVSPSAKSKT